MAQFYKLNFADAIEENQRVINDLENGPQLKETLRKLVPYPLIIVAVLIMICHLLAIQNTLFHHKIEG